MTLHFARARQHLTRGNLRALFIEELGWDRHTAALEVTVDGSTVVLHALAQKRGMVAFQCQALAGERLPDYALRRKIEHRVARSVHEHLIVFTETTNETQVWQWVKREVGKPVACREHTHHRSQPGDALLQKLAPITFALEEEQRLSLVDVARRARAGFDVERITKRFYDHFQKEHALFLKFITGIPESADREWYASVMLNRLMFVYFIQRKGFLDGDRDYLRNRLLRMRAEHGKDKFYSFYRYFLVRLFHEGLGGKARTRELEKLVGRIPYLNGGLFDVHELEKADRYGKTIQIPDSAFVRIFDYFDQYQWHLDERPLRADNEINPDVLGYIFEKYINQKQMGAYYTKEDITEYISKSTVLPFLFEAARARCKVAFENAKGPTVWDMLRHDPDRYIYPAVRHGAGEPLPADIAAGLKPSTLHNTVGDGRVRTLDLRKNWNSSAPATHALPTETWREVIARRRRYEDIKTRLATGDVSDINELINLNLDVRQFAQDAIENCEGPDLLRAFWGAIEKVTILDPTCGSGAFLFAALTILEPLYEACLDRMEAFVEDLERSGEKHHPEKYSDFRKVLDRVSAHPNRRYFVFKSIILNNLFGVDIMEEAVDICKLRLFLKLAAQVEPEAARDNFGIEPLPDIDFNIRAGNTLVGYATLDAVKQGIGSKLDFDNAAERISARAADLRQAFDAFRAGQIQGDGSVPTGDKQELRRRLKGLDDELNRHLAGEYGVAPSKKDALSAWLTSHRPFHWFVEFYGIMSAGGFDVIVGNPPYVEYSQVSGDYVVKGYKTEPCGNLYAFTWERSVALGGLKGRLGMIIPVSSVSTDGYATLRKTWLSAGNLVISSYGDRPGKLFDGLEHIRLAIVLLTKSTSPGTSVYTTTYRKWSSEARENLFSTLSFTRVRPRAKDGLLPKLGESVEALILERTASRRTLEHYASSRGRHNIYYTRKLGWFVQVLDFVPQITDARGREREPSELKTVSVATPSQLSAYICLLNSSLFYWLLNVWSDCRNLNRREVLGAPLDWGAMSQANARALNTAAGRLMRDFRRNAKVLEMNYAKWGVMRIQCIYPKHSKSILDEIDTVLGRHLGLTEEELDFVVNYDLKYRVGAGAEGEDE